MMDIVVCIEQTLDPASIEVDDLTGQLDEDRAVYVTNIADLAAVEEALRIRDEVGGWVSAFSVGPQRVEQSLCECLGLGVDKVLRIWNEDWPDDATPAAVAFALTNFIKEEPYDLVLCGDSGSYFQAGQVSAWIAEYLGLPHIAGVTDLEVVNHGQKLVVKRKLEKGRRQVMECTVPVVLTIDASLSEHKDITLPDLIDSLETKVPSADLSFGSILRRSPNAGAMIGEKYQICPINPRPHLIFSPDSSLCAYDRIAELISGGLVDRRGIVVEGEPHEAAGYILDFLGKKGLLPNSEPRNDEKDRDA